MTLAGPALTLPDAEFSSPHWLRELGLPLRLRSLPGHRVVEHRLRDPLALQPVIHAALPLTLTPYAATGPCPARCVFCSENLRVEGAGRHASMLRPGPDWLPGLKRALHALDGLPFGISLSGLEPTRDCDWLLALLDALRQHEVNASQPFTEKILYSNGTGFGREQERDRLLDALCDFGLQRVEWSRHGHEQAINDGIMRFRPDAAIGDQQVFERSLAAVTQRLPVTLVCLLQRGGVDTVSGLVAYLSWAEQQGVSGVVFREFARTGANYRRSFTQLTLQQRRVGCEAALRRLLNSDSELAAVALTEGYYFWSVELLWRGRLRVVFESSDYRRLQQLHASNTVYKLVYHNNGHLCADWDPQQRVLLRCTD